MNGCMHARMNGCMDNQLYNMDMAWHYPSEIPPRGEYITIRKKEKVCV